MLLDLPYYNILLNIEEFCIESFEDRNGSLVESFSLDDCSQAAKVLVEFYLPLLKHKRRDFEYLKNMTKNKLIEKNLDKLVEMCDENDKTNNWFDLYSKMFARLDYLLYEYLSEDL